MATQKQKVRTLQDECIMALSAENGVRTLTLVRLADEMNDNFLMRIQFGRACRNCEVDSGAVRINLYQFGALNGCHLRRIPHSNFILSSLGSGNLKGKSVPRRRP